MRLLIVLAAASLISAGLADPEALTIAVPGETIPAEKTAARELSGHLERMTGRRVAIVPEDKVAGAAAIHLGATAYPGPRRIRQGRVGGHRQGRRACVGGRQTAGDALRRAADLDNLYMACRCISGDFFTQASYRITGTAVEMGYNVGVAAAGS